MTNAIDPSLERQYNNRDAVADHADYLRNWANHGQQFRQLKAVQGSAHLDIKYGASSRQLLDIFPLQQKAPVHVFIHGGYWQALNKDSFSFMAEAFNQQGECAVILNYDLCPETGIGQIIQQIQQAFVWIARNIDRYGGDAKRIQVTGHSAGGHLLAYLLLMDWKQQGISQPPALKLNAISGLFDLQPLVATSVNQKLGLDVEQARQVSPLFDKPKIENTELNLYVGELESTAFKNQSINLVQQWEELLPINYQPIPQCHHFSVLDGFLKDFYRPI